MPPARKPLPFLQVLWRLLRESRGIARVAAPRKTVHYLTALWREKCLAFDGKVVINMFFPPFPGRAFLPIVADCLDFPGSVHLAVTNRCHQLCRYCNLGASPPRDLSTAQMLDILKQVQDLTAPIIGFTGGEALMREDIETLLAGVDDRSSTILYTSGTGLTAAKALSLKRAGLFAISISLDHADRAVNDAHRFPGSHDAALRGIQNALAAGLFTVASVVVSGETLESFPSYLAFANQLGVHGIRVLDIIPSGACIDRPPLDARSRARLIEWCEAANRDPSLPQITCMARLEGPDQFGCGAGGVYHMYIDGEGYLRPCDFIPIRFGNLAEEPLAVVYRRMRRYFPRTRDFCFMKRHSRRLAALLGGRPCLPWTEAVGFLEAVRNDPPPRMFTRIHGNHFHSSTRGSSGN